MCSLHPARLPARAGWPRPQVIAIDQDASFTAGDRLRNDTSGAQVWARDLLGGDKAVVLFNSRTSGANVTVAVRWEELGWAPGRNVTVRDVWERRDIGLFSDGLSASLSPKDVLFARLTPAAAPAPARALQ